MIKKCQQCNKEFKTYPVRIKKGKGKFCGQKCYWIFLKGKPSAVLGKHWKIKDTSNMKGSTFWLKKKLSKEHVEKLKQTKLENPVRYWLGKKRNPEMMKKIHKQASFKLKGKIPKHFKEFQKKGWIANKKRYSTLEGREELRSRALNNPNRLFKDTKIELKMEELLKRLEIAYQKQVPLYKIARVDFYVPSKNLVIQCDGCFWHGCPEHNPTWIKNRERDANQDKVLSENGLKVIRFWEHEIMSPNFNILNLVN